MGLDRNRDLAFREKDRCHQINLFGKGGFSLGKGRLDS
jgi:hypothetical protein